MSAPRKLGDPVTIRSPGRPRDGQTGYVVAFWGPARYWCRVALDEGTTPEVAVPRERLTRIPRKRRRTA